MNASASHSLLGCGNARWLLRALAWGKGRGHSPRLHVVALRFRHQAGALHDIAALVNVIQLTHIAGREGAEHLAYSQLVVVGCVVHKYGVGSGVDDR